MDSDTQGNEQQREELSQQDNPLDVSQEGTKDIECSTANVDVDAMSPMQMYDFFQQKGYGGLAYSLFSANSRSVAKRN